MCTHRRIEHNYQLCNDIMRPKVYHTSPLLQPLKSNACEKKLYIIDSDKIPEDMRPHTASESQLYLRHWHNFVSRERVCVRYILLLSKSRPEIRLSVKVCMLHVICAYHIYIVFTWFGYGSYTENGELWWIYFLLSMNFPGTLTNPLYGGSECLAQVCIFVTARPSVVYHYECYWNG